MFSLPLYHRIDDVVSLFQEAAVQVMEQEWVTQKLVLYAQTCECDLIEFAMLTLYCQWLFFFVCIFFIIAT